MLLRGTRERSVDDVGHWQQPEGDDTGGAPPSDPRAGGRLDGPPPTGPPDAGPPAAGPWDLGPGDTRPLRRPGPAPTRRLPPAEGYPAGDDPDEPWRWGSTAAHVPSVGGALFEAEPEPGVAVEPARRRRLWRWLAAALVMLLVALAVVDRLAAHLAASEMASQVQKSQQLPTRPGTSVGGFPFLTQVVLGDYQDIGLNIRRVAASGVCVDDIDVHVKGVHLPLSKLIGNDVKTVPIDRVVGSVRLTYADLNAYLARQPGGIQLAAAGSGMRISAPIDVPIIGQVTVFGDVRLGVEGDHLTITATGIGVAGLGAVPLPEDLARDLAVSLPLTGLPLNLRLTSAKTTPTGIDVTAEADHLTLNTTTAPTGPQLRAC